MNPKLVFVAPVIVDKKTGTYFYDFYYSENPDVVWGNYWNYDNPAIVDNEDIFPQDSTYSFVERVKSDYKLGVAMKNACYPLLYCIYGILALAWIDIEDLEEYPENGRGVVKFGMEYDEVQEIVKQYQKESE